MLCGQCLHCLLICSATLSPGYLFSQTHNFDSKSTANDSLKELCQLDFFKSD